jgi:SnoaL-like domain
LCGSGFAGVGCTCLIRSAICGGGAVPGLNVSLPAINGAEGGAGRTPSLDGRPLPAPALEGPCSRHHWRGADARLRCRLRLLLLQTLLLLLPRQALQQFRRCPRHRLRLDSNAASGAVNPILASVRSPTVTITGLSGHVPSTCRRVSVGHDHQDRLSDAFEALDQAWNAGDADGIAAVFASDCVLVSPYGVLVRGRDAVRELFRIGFSATLKGSSRRTVIEICPACSRQHHVLSWVDHFVQFLRPIRQH